MDKKNENLQSDSSSCCPSCSECSDCLLPWRMKKSASVPNQPDGSHQLEHVDYHFRGRVDSTCSITAPVSTEIVTQQPTNAALDASMDTKDVSDSATSITTVIANCSKSHKKSVTSLDTAILASSAGILSQVVTEHNSRSNASAVAGSTSIDNAQLQISLTFEESYSTLLVFYAGLRNYHSISLLPGGSGSSATGLTETSPLIASGNSAGSALMLRFSLMMGVGTQVGSPNKGGSASTSSFQQICFTSIQTRSKNPVWKENISLEANVRHQNEQKLVVVLYETNKFTKWTPVKVGFHPCAGFLIPGTQNLSLDLHNISEDVYPFGQIKLSICYNKSTHRVYLDILEARSLFHWALTKKGEYFIKVQFFDHKKITKMKKTAAVKSDATSLVQIFETIRAKVPLASLNNLGIKVMLCDAKILMSDSCLYYVYFGQENSSGATEATYWADFLREVPASGHKEWFSMHQKV